MTDDRYTDTDDDEDHEQRGQGRDRPHPAELETDAPEGRANEHCWVCHRPATHVNPGYPVEFLCDDHAFDIDAVPLDEVDATPAEIREAAADGPEIDTSVAANADANTTATENEGTDETDRTAALMPAGYLKPAGESEMAARIREAIGADPDEDVIVHSPQFERHDGVEPDDSPLDEGEEFEALRNLPTDALINLGMRRWSGDLWLFPFEWHDAIPEGFEVTTINGYTEEFEADGTHANPDKRMGVLAYGVVVTPREYEADDDEPDDEVDPAFRLDANDDDAADSDDGGPTLRRRDGA